MPVSMLLLLPCNRRRSKTQSVEDKNPIVHNCEAESVTIKDVHSPKQSMFAIIQHPHAVSLGTTHPGIQISQVYTYTWLFDPVYYITYCE